MSSKYSNTPFEQHIGLLQTVLSVDGNPQIIYRAIPDNGMLFEVSESRKAYNEKLKPLRRPSRLVQIWPRILIIPPALYLMLRFVYNARGSIIQHAHEAVETVRAFWESWILQPTRNIIATVRTGGDEGVRVISKDALKADLDVSK
jgi:nuclear-control-of-ATPase protein 2